MKDYLQHLKSSMHVKSLTDNICTDSVLMNLKPPTILARTRQLQRVRIIAADATLLVYLLCFRGNTQCCQVSVFYRNFTDLSWLSSRTTPPGYKRTERGTPSQPCITSPFKQQTISQSCSHHFLLKYDQ